MGTHPNAMMMAVITPDHGSRKTQRMIISHCQERGIEASLEDSEICVFSGKRGPVTERHPDGFPITDRWRVQVMESDYEEGYQISASEGQIVIHDFITYGYGDKTSWEDLLDKKKQLDELLEPMAKELEFSYQVFIGANYW